jgi:photosystem II stability/assembly factor-like uncharacterized protein
MSYIIDGKSRRWLLGAAIVGLGVLALAGCTDAPSEQPAATTTEGEASPASGAEPVTAPAEWEHVHNLTLDGSRLLVGTHEGLWVQSLDQPAQLVSDPPFDVMGLALSGPRMLASGHPGAGQDLPADLGLQQSTDDGVTWTSVSLAGEVDFHRLSVSGRVLLGLSASDGRLLRSPDGGATWADLGTPPLYDLAVSPTDAETVIGTTEQGPVSSDDGGTTFTPLADAPLLALLSWTPSHLYGVTPDGALHTSTDEGATWDEAGTVPGQPAAIAAQGKHVVVLAGDTIFESTNGGANFAPRIIGVSGH